MYPEELDMAQAGQLDGSDIAFIVCSIMVITTFLFMLARERRQK